MGDTRREGYPVHVTPEACDQWVAAFGADPHSGHGARQRIKGLYHAGTMTCEGGACTVSGIERSSTKGVRLTCTPHGDVIHIVQVTRCEPNELAGAASREAGIDRGIRDEERVQAPNAGAAG